jgi:hypothetical protein
LCVATPVYARSQKTLAYPHAESFSAAVRFIRVDEGLKLIEKDSDAGYVIFELREEKKVFRGSLEVIDVDQDGRRAIRFVIAIEDRPEYVELQMLNRLEKKLRAELGSPAPAPSRKREGDGNDAPKKSGDKPTTTETHEKPGEHPDEGPPISNTP